MRTIFKHPYAPPAASSRLFLLVSASALFLLCLSAFPLSASAGAEAGGGYTSDQWKEFGLRTMNFVVFAVILYLLLNKLVRNFFKGKKENISRTLEYLETQARNLEEQNQVMKRRLSQLAQEREGILAQYERDGQKERDRLIAEAKTAADLIVRKAQTAAEQELKQARRELARSTGALAVGMAGDLIRENITAEDKNALVHNFLDQLARLNNQRT
ncbi:MAG: ATP synthase F0 subunit B [Deltaproteobacteria bacterium]|jgi:F-type H+-transporting ATPase subunit b|nr:ATP synthase F0 subunit B [Deltaproteobacteria bacterium]